jgi:hypothetical protein
LVIALISLAYLEEDGILLSIALLAAVIIMTVATMGVWEVVVGARCRPKCGWNSVWRILR